MSVQSAISVFLLSPKCDCKFNFFPNCNIKSFTLVSFATTVNPPSPDPYLTKVKNLGNCGEKTRKKQTKNSPFETNLY